MTVTADGIEGLLETAHLQRSPRNTSRLLAALEHAGGNNLASQRLENLENQLEAGAPSESHCAIRNFGRIFSSGSRLIGAMPGRLLAEPLAACWS